MTNPSEAKNYSDLLIAAIKDLSSSLSKQALLVLLVMAVFELLVYQPASNTVSVGAFSFTNTATLLIAVPMIVSYLVYDVICLSQRWTLLYNAYYFIQLEFWPNQAENDLTDWVMPVLPGSWRIGGFVNNDNESSRSEKFLFRVNMVISIGATLILPIAFEIQAYVVLFSRFQLANAFLWVSVVASAGLIAATLAYLHLVEPGTDG